MKALPFTVFCDVTSVRHISCKSKVSVVAMQFLNLMRIFYSYEDIQLF